MRPQAGQHQFGAQSEEIPNSVMPALPAKLTADCTDAEGRSWRRSLVLQNQMKLIGPVPLFEPPISSVRVIAHVLII